MLVAMDDSESPVSSEIAFAMPMMMSAPVRPAWPTTQPVLRKRMMPRMVSTLGVNTPANVPKRPATGAEEGRSGMGRGERAESSHAGGLGEGRSGSAPAPRRRGSVPEG